MFVIFTYDFALLPRKFDKITRKIKCLKSLRDMFPIFFYETRLTLYL